ncbi:MAG: adenosylcobinamide-phosphate synthase CbiB [Clostridia bacterium]|nr:adenosylcobinamide-phosphate synthase CbiB [Clostridia bacterium]
MYALIPLLLGFILDLIIGDPHSIPHPVVLIGKLISFLEKAMRKIFPKTVRGENIAGLFIWLLTVSVSFLVPFGILFLAGRVSPYLSLIIESLMIAQILATKSLKDESMKVSDAVKTGDIELSRKAVSMIVGRDTAELDFSAVTRAACETVAENTSDGVIAPLLFIILGGAPLGFLYKAVNTMDSMLGYTEMPYKNVGLVPAKMDDFFNYLPARISALVMLLSGALLKKDVKNGWKIFVRDRYNHASPNSAQTESVMAGLLNLRFAGDAYYHGVLHKKKYIGDNNREIEVEDIERSCSIMQLTALLSLLIFGGIKALILLL